ncbi:CBS domain-containing protein [Marinimicrobium sp. C6131]|uniref:CBS domain-containing protein n=1 Tax=Marinimicrobium sp. C6131 TaxID=3022676 RepID=UPI00223D610F|nr:CBS domain-containing protein [Marinimicrobium sp. C6131]UZJ43550.1 CBS domain-containing protein [Marinimicrobium sp. C6131]
MLVKSVMHRGAKVCPIDSNLETIAATMWNEDSGAIPLVAENDRVVGLITDRDIAMAAALKHRPLWEISARELVEGKACHFCHEDEDIHSVLKTMGSLQIRRMPVVNSEQQMVGMISLKDLIDHTASRRSQKNKDALTPEEVLAMSRMICETRWLQAAS